MSNPSIIISSSKSEEGQSSSSSSSNVLMMKGGTDDNVISISSSNGSNNTMTSRLSASHYRGGTGEIIEIMEEEDEDNMITSSSSSSYLHDKNNNSDRGGGGGGGISTSLFSIDINNNNNIVRWTSSDGGNNNKNVVYVCVGKSESSSSALLWALNHAVIPGTTLVYLVHVFSEDRFIPSPLGGGRVAKSQVSRELVESHETQERSKRRELVTKYVDKCNSHQVQVETILIEHDSVGYAIVELISVLNITNIILGISTSNLRKLKSGKWNGSIVSDQVRQNAQSGCEVKIICQGKDIIPTSDLAVKSTPSPTTTAAATRDQDPANNNNNNNNNSFSCCFRPSANDD